MGRVTPGWHERQRAYRTFEQLGHRLQEADTVLADTARGRTLHARPDLPDGWPTGLGSGAGSGDVSDPTASAVSVRERMADRQADLAEQALCCVVQAALLLAQADSLRARALETPTPRPEPIRRPEELWCTSCARARDQLGQQAIFEPRTSRKGGRQDLCDWCQGEWLGSHLIPHRRELPDVRLVEAHHRGVRLTEARRAEILGRRSKGA